jgi:hypothetical protein
MTIRQKDETPIITNPSDKTPLTNASTIVPLIVLGQFSDVRFGRWIILCGFIQTEESVDVPVSVSIEVCCE